MSIIAEAALSALFELLLKKLASADLLKFAREKQVVAEIRKWEIILTKIQAVLDDAEEKQMINRSVKIWLSDLKHLAYDVEDIMDEFATECLQRKLTASESQSSSKSKLEKLLPSCFAYFNPKNVMFNSTMMGKMEDISAKLEEVASRRNDLDLREIVGQITRKVWKPPSSTCLQNEPQMYGRDDDKRRILDLMLKEENRVTVVPIVGMGGVGKTTLARMVYHDKECVYFDVKAWVCVSDEFDVVRITKGILESITLQPCDLKELNQVQLMLSKELRGKRFLIVLDDVWSENYGDWNVLSSPFMDGANGSKVIITTRSAVVGKMMGNVENHTLSCISDDDCWSLFARHAFENRSISVDLRAIKEKVAYRCGGLPLAAKTLGGILRSKHESEWGNVLSSKIWNLKGSDGGSGSGILPVLRLSYFHLPSYLKGCFSYCAILPKDYEFDEKELVLLWMAEGLIQQTMSDKPMEDIGMEYFHDLSSRSLFQPSGNEEGLFVMHDLVNDLAISVAGDSCFRLEDEFGVSEEFISKKARHSSYVRGACDGVGRFRAFHEIKCLRTFLPLSLTYEASYIAYDIPSKVLPKLRCLRVLSFSHYNITELPDSIGELKHLRYLNLSYTKIRTLPESITCLWNLQTLILEECSCLKELPSHIGNLVNLRHLDLTNVYLAKGFPLGVNELKNLLTLSNFSVGKDGGAGLEILKDLKFLRGELHISLLENVNNIEQVREANLMDKKDLDALHLEWEFDGSRDERLDRDVLDGMQPHRKLKTLSVTGYSGTSFPPWIGDSYLQNLGFLKLEDCKKCISLPQIGWLPSLKDLIIKGMVSVKMIDHEYYGESNLNPFPVLETLHFMNMHGLEEWNTHGVAFPCLRELVIQNCPKLSGKLPNHLPLLKKLVIRECEQLVVSLPSLPKISVLEIERCKVVDCALVIEFGSSCNIVLSGIPRFLAITNGFIQGLKNARDLNVIGDSFPSQADFASFSVDGEDSKLESLKLNDCRFLLPYWSLSLICLRELTIEDCSRIVSFPQISFPATLRVVEIQNCNSLLSFPDSSLYNCSNLEVLRIDRCNSLVSFGSGTFPPSLKRLVIQFCHSLQSLYQSEDEKNSSNLEFLSIEGCHSLTLLSLPFSLKHIWISYCSALVSLSSDSELPIRLEHIQIWNCPELLSISSTANLPASLKHLEIWYCSKLVSITKTFDSNTSLECISIRKCDNLKSLPNNIHKLINLHNISISGWPSLELNNESEGFLVGIHKISSLQTLSINDCPGIISFPEEGFPTTLTTLWMANLEICKSLFEWGVHRLAFLTELHILGGPDVMSFPDDEINMMLPSSLIHLSIGDFINLEYLSTRGFRNLASLEFLSILNCPKLVSLPKNGLPQSVSKLFINNCPALKERCMNEKGSEWFKIVHIPLVKIDGMYVFDTENDS